MTMLKSLFRIFLFLVAALVVLVPMLSFEENWRGAHDWAAYVKDHEARGESLDFKQLAPPPVPDDQNFAMTPLLAPLYQADQEKAKDYADQFRAKFSLPAIPGKTQPRMGDAEMGRPINIVEWRDYLGMDVLEWLKRFDAPLEEISGAVRRPYSRFPVAYGEGYAMEVRHASPLSKLATLFILRAHAELDGGQTDWALRDVETVFRLENSMKDEPLFISQLVRIVMLAQVQQVIWEGLEAHRWTDAHLALLQTNLRDDNLLNGLQLALREGRASLNTSAEKGSVIFKKNIPNGIFRRMQLNVNLFHDQYSSEVVDVPARRIRKDAATAADARLDQMRYCHFLGMPLFNPYNLLTVIASLRIVSVTEKFAYEQSMTDLALVACALERHRLANGRFPDTLAQLVPKYFDAIPLDALHGEQPKYHLNPDGTYLLYLKGWDGNDNGGKVILRPDGKGIDYKKSDWVWSPRPL